jgi:hypothetical protein
MSEACYNKKNKKNRYGEDSGGVKGGTAIWVLAAFLFAKLNFCVITFFHSDSP